MSGTLGWHVGKTYQAALEQVHLYHGALLEAIGRLSLEDCALMTQEILAVHARQARLFIFGNGGSAATASHMACDLGKNTAVANIHRLNVHSLTDNAPLITALANDLGYDVIFSEQLVQAAIGRNDVVVAISGSGNSQNVLAGVATARAAGARAIALTGGAGGHLATIADIVLTAHSTSMEIIEDVHLAINHIVTTAVHEALVGLATQERHDEFALDDGLALYPLPAHGH